MLLFMGAICVLPGGYIAFERNRRQKRAEAIKAIEELGGEVNGWMPSRDWAELPFIYGEDTKINNVHWGENHRVTDADLKVLKVFPELEQLDLCDTNITDEGLAQVAGLTNLDWLGLDKTRITDAGMVYLKNMQKLETLSLEHTQITDNGLPHLTDLKALRLIRLDSGTKVTDAAIEKFNERFWPDGIINRAP